MQPGGSRTKITRRLGLLGEPLECAGRKRIEPCALCRQPTLKLRRGKEKTVQEGALVKGDGGGIVAGPEPALELANIAAEVGQVQAYVFGGLEQVVAVQAAARGVERLGERVAGPRGRLLGPQDAHQLVTAQARPARGRKHSQQRNGAPLRSGTPHGKAIGGDQDRSAKRLQSNHLSRFVAKMSPV